MKIKYTLALLFSMILLSCQKSDNNYLSQLGLSSGELIPRFSSEIYEYNISSLNALKPINVVTTAQDRSAKVFVNEQLCNDLVEIKLDSLSKDGTIEICVIAENGKIRKYKIRHIPNDFPKITSKKFGDCSDGLIYLSNMKLDLKFKPDIGRYLLILDNDGMPVYYKKMKIAAADFTLQPNGSYTFFVPNHFKLPEIFGYFEVMDSNFNVVDKIEVKHGYTDLHECIIDKDDNITILGVDLDTLKEKGIGENNEAVTWNYFIEQRNKEDEIIFEWKIFDYLSIEDILDVYPLNLNYIEHGANCNAIDIYSNGDILLSSRKLDEITKIDRKTGKVIWRMGGVNCENNQFKHINDPFRGFSHQHSVNILTNGNILLFDNGNYRTKDLLNQNIFKIPHTRVVEYKIDEKKKTAELVWSYAEPGVFAPIMGSCQRLSNGNTFICWSKSNPIITEITPDGKKVLEISLDDGFESYNAFKY